MSDDIGGSYLIGFVEIWRADCSDMTEVEGDAIMKAIEESVPDGYVYSAEWRAGIGACEEEEEQPGGSYLDNMKLGY